MSTTEQSSKPSKPATGKARPAARRARPRLASSATPARAGAAKGKGNGQAMPAAPADARRGDAPNIPAVIERMARPVADAALDVARIAESVGGADVSGSLDPVNIRAALGDMLRPAALKAELPSAMAQMFKAFLGLGDGSLLDKDPRFADPAWREHAGYRMLGQSYRSWEKLVYRLVERAGSQGWEQRERARFVANVLTGALSPTNTLLGNPVALKRAIDSGGRSVVKGLRNMVQDIANNGGMPRTVDSRPYRVGGNLAATPGAVVYREEMFELLQYAPATPTVRRRPLVMVPPQLNRHYVLDLAPGRSLAEYAVAHGVQTFIIVWRNPRPEHARWGLDDYLAAMLRALDVVRAITDCEDVNWLGLCAGGVTSSLMLGHLAATGRMPVHSITLFVTMLASSTPNMVGTLVTRGSRESVAKAAAKGKIFSAHTMKRNFALMRPSDMIYGYVVNGWLLGNDPPSFDILAWNDDATGITATFERDTVAVLGGNDAAVPGAVSVLGTPIDLSQVKIDSYQVAGEKDHITTWRACYGTSQIYGGRCQMVVANTGHIQTFVNPPTETRYSYVTGLADDADPDVWMSKGSRHSGTWWPHWIEWLVERSGADKPAPQQLGNDEHPPLDAAPGRYVHEK